MKPRQAAVIMLIAVSIFAVSCNQFKEPAGDNRFHGDSPSNALQQQNNSSDPQQNQNNSNPASYDSGLQSVNKCTFRFEEGMEKNLSLDAFIKWANKNSDKAVDLSFLLKNGTKICLGDHKDYTLTALFAKGKESNTIKVSNLRFTMKPQNDAIEQKINGFFYSYTAQLTKPYFTKQAALTHILRQVEKDTSWCKADPTTFASVLYANAKIKGTPVQAAVLDDEKLKPYQDCYANKDGVGAFTINNLGAYIYNGSIEADDYNGSLDITYIIASADDMTGTSIQASELSEPSSKTVTGFRKIDENTAQTLFPFGVIGTSDEAWKKKATQSQGEPLLQESEDAQDFINRYSLQQKMIDKFGKESESCHLTLNSGTDFSHWLLENNNTLSKCSDGKHILVKGIMLLKNKTENDLTITMTFCGSGSPIKWNVAPKIN